MVLEGRWEGVMVLVGRWEGVMVLVGRCEGVMLLVCEGCAVVSVGELWLVWAFCGYLV